MMNSAATSSTRFQVIFAHIFLVMQQFCSVTVYVLGKKILATVEVQQFVFMRLMMVVPAVAISAVLLTRKREAFKIPWRMMVWVAASGIVGILIAQTVMFMGLDKSTPTNTSIISAPCIPMFTALFSVIRGTDKITLPKGMGFLFSVAGALLLLQVWNFELKGTTLGNLLIVASTLCSACNALLQKHILNGGYHPLVCQFYICTIGLVSYMTAYVPFGLFDPVEWSQSTTTWGYIAIVGIGATAFPWCMGIVALKHTSPMTTGIYIVLQPLIAVAVGIVLGEEFAWFQAMGGLLVLSGLLCFNATALSQHVLPAVKRALHISDSKSFVLLGQEDEQKIGIELSVMDGDSGESQENQETSYELTPSAVETNAFVIEDEEEQIELQEETPAESVDFKYKGVPDFKHTNVVEIPDGADVLIVAQPRTVSALA